MYTRFKDDGWHTFISTNLRSLEISVDAARVAMSLLLLLLLLLLLCCGGHHGLDRIRKVHHRPLAPPCLTEGC